MKLKSLFLTIFLMGAATLGNAKDYDVEINNVYDLLKYQNANKGMNDKNRTSLIENQMRMRLLEDYAKQSAMKAAMIATNKQINDLILNGSRELDAIYNFNLLMIQGRVIPPVITMATDLYNQKGADQIRLSKRIYNIERQASFSSTAPNWRNYLKVNYDADAFDTIGYIGGDLSPKNPDEMKVWEQATIKGWNMGVNQAGIALEQKLERLNRDYIGMVRFHLLALQGKVTMPAVSSYNLYDKNTGTQWVIDEQLLRLETLPEFKRVGGDKILSIQDNGVINNKDANPTPSITPAYSKSNYANGPAPYKDDVVDDVDSNNIVASPTADFNKNNATIAPLSTIQINKGLDYQKSENAPSSNQVLPKTPKSSYDPNQPSNYLSYAKNEQGLSNLSVPVDPSTIIKPPVKISDTISQSRPTVEDTLQKVVDQKDIAPKPSLSPLDYTVNPLGTKVEKVGHLTITTTTSFLPVAKNSQDENSKENTTQPVVVEK